MRQIWCNVFIHFRTANFFPSYQSYLNRMRIQTKGKKAEDIQRLTIPIISKSWTNGLNVYSTPFVSKIKRKNVFGLAISWILFAILSIVGCVCVCMCVIDDGLTFEHNMHLRVWSVRHLGAHTCTHTHTHAYTYTRISNAPNNEVEIKENDDEMKMNFHFIF